jgi:hypothetical protein
VFVTVLLNDVADDAADDRALQRLAMVDQGTGSRADDRAARFTVVMAAAIRRVHDPAMMMSRVSKGALSRSQQRQAEKSSPNSLRDLGGHLNLRPDENARLMPKLIEDKQLMNQLLTDIFAP